MIPLSATEHHEYTPPNLANLPIPPKFLFRPATPRDKRAFDRALMIEGLRPHGPDAIRNAMRAELRRLWSAEVCDVEMQKLNSFWVTVDQNESLPEGDRIIIPVEQIEAYEELCGRVYAASATIRSMQADNAEFNAYAPKVALGLFLTGWKGLQSPFRREAGAVSIDTLAELEAELAATEQAAIIDKVADIGEPGQAFVSITLHALQMMGLATADEGKSDSPSPSSQSPKPSRNTSKRPAAAGKSPAARPSKATPAN